MCPSQTASKLVYHREEIVMLCTWFVLRLCYLDKTRLAVSSGVIVLAVFNVFAMIVVQSMSSDEELPEDLRIMQMCFLLMCLELKYRTPGKINRIILVCFAALMFHFFEFLCCWLHSIRAFHQLQHPGGLAHESMLSGVSAQRCRNRSVPNNQMASGRTLRCLEFAKGRQEVIVNRVRLCTVSGSGAMALVASDLGSLNTINGSFSCGAFVAFCSCVVGLYQLGPKSERPGWRFAMHVLAVLGNAVASLCLFYAVSSGKCVVADFFLGNGDRHLDGVAILVLQVRCSGTQWYAVVGVFLEYMDIDAMKFARAFCSARGRGEMAMAVAASARFALLLRRTPDTVPWSLYSYPLFVSTLFWLLLSILFLMSVLLVRRLLLASVFYLAPLRLLVDA